MDLEKKSDLLSQPSIHEIFDVFEKGKRDMPNLTEDDLKSCTTDRKPEAIFVPISLQKNFAKLPQAVKDKYKWYGEQYYNDAIDNITKGIEDRADELLLAVKSGLSTADLTDDERVLLRNQYGSEWYTLANLEQEDS
jgi:hypothetical protein